MALLARIAAALLTVSLKPLQAPLLAARGLAARLAFASGRGHAADAVARGGPVRSDLSANHWTASRCEPLKLRWAPPAAARAGFS